MKIKMHVKKRKLSLPHYTQVWVWINEFKPKVAFRNGSYNLRISKI